MQVRNVINSFQSQLNEGIKQIKRDSKIFVPADKSRNIYKWYRETFESYCMKASQRLTKKRIRLLLKIKNIMSTDQSIKIRHWKT